MLAKTDRLDARVLRLYGESTPCRVHEAMPPELKQLAALGTLRDQLVKMQTQLRNAAEHLTLRSAVQSTRTLNRAIDKEIEKLERAAREVIAQHAALKQRCSVLVKQYGVGELIATTLLTLLPELGAVNRQKIAALAGLAPYANDSGPRKGHRHIRGGRGRVRRALYLATVTAIRQKKSPLQLCYQRLRAAGKPAKVAIIAAARKLLIYLNSQLQPAALSSLTPSPFKLISKHSCLFVVWCLFHTSGSLGVKSRMDIMAVCTL